MRLRLLLTVVLCGGLAAAAAAGAAAFPEDPPLMIWDDLTARPLPRPQETIRYRPGEAGVVDVWLPEGDGPHPTVVMVHGGCWQKAIADRTLMNYAAEAMRTRGFAVWNIEYRGVDEAGGGYPGTFRDVADAVDAVRDHAARLELAGDRLIAYGHSAGGHLAAWAAHREKLPTASPLHKADPIPLAAVVNAGGLADLAASVPVTLPSCLAAIGDALTGPPFAARPDVYSDTSPVSLLPGAARQISVNGARDRIAPPALGMAYSWRVGSAGGEAEYVEVPGGHVELIAPGTDAFAAQLAIIETEFGRP